MPSSTLVIHLSRFFTIPNVYDSIRVDMYDILQGVGTWECCRGGVCPCAARGGGVGQTVRVRGEAGLESVTRDTLSASDQGVWTPMTQMMEKLSGSLETIVKANPETTRELGSSLVEYARTSHGNGHFLHRVLCCLPVFLCKHFRGFDYRHFQ